MKTVSVPALRFAFVVGEEEFAPELDRVIVPVIFDLFDCIIDRRYKIIVIK